MMKGDKKLKFREIMVENSKALKMHRTMKTNGVKPVSTLVLFEKNVFLLSSTTFVLLSYRYTNIFGGIFDVVATNSLSKPYSKAQYDFSHLFASFLRWRLLLFLMVIYILQSSQFSISQQLECPFL